MPVVVVELTCRPRTVVLVLSVTVLPRLAKVPFPLFMAGKVALLPGGVSPVIVERLAVASWPINFCPLKSVMAPVYCVALS